MSPTKEIVTGKRKKTKEKEIERITEVRMWRIRSERAKSFLFTQKHIISDRSRDNSIRKNELQETYLGVFQHN